MLDGKVVRETCLNSTVDYFYDNDGRPYKFTVKVGANDPVEGYYVLNLQGDVIAILDKDGAVAVEYEYDSWGNILMDSAAEQTGQTGRTLQFYNALKYRGYYYDTDLEMYYLNSRFYDPAISRFINADSAISGTNGELLGYNMFTYCFNNPVNLDDTEGNWPKWAQKIGNAVKKAVTKTVSKVTNIVKKAVSAATKKYKEETSKITYSSNGKKEGAKIQNSYEVRDLVIMYAYIKQNRGEDVTGSTSGVVYEWVVHNVAYDAGKVIRDLGYTDVGQKIMDKGKDLDFGSTIYDDNHGLESRLMQISYYALSPQNAIYDLIVEIFE